jgi:hypothetical protein
VTVTEPQHPLHWPAHLPRTAAKDRRQSAFKVSPQRAYSELVEEVTRFGGHGAIFSTNAPRRRDGRIYSDALDEPMQDPGVAAYFTRDGRRVVFACDTFLTIWENLRALHGTIEALRRIERNGAHQLFNQAFTGFAALPAPGAAPWWTILGVPATATADEITAAWRDKQRALGATGNDAARAELNIARDKGLAERNAG